MTAQYESLLRCQEESLRHGDLYTAVALPLTPVDPHAPRHAAKIRRRAERKQTTWAMEDLVEQLGSEDAGARADAVKRVRGKLTVRYFSERKPHLVEPLVRLLAGSPDGDVRAIAASALEAVAPDGDLRAIEALTSGLDHSDILTAISCLYGMHAFLTPAALQPMGRLLERLAGHWAASAVATHLGDLGDSRAIPFLVKAMEQPSASDLPLRTAVALALAKVGGAQSSDELARLIDSEDPQVRSAALIGLREMRDPRAQGIAKRLQQHDSDAEVRRIAGDTTRMLGPQP
jgi:HEAT repeat protein